MWILFRVPTPTAAGESAKDLYEKRIPWITAEMQESARSLGCTFHRAWHAQDGTAFYALASWVTREGASEFFQRWNIEAELGEEAIVLEGDVGLVPLPDLS